MKRKTGYLIVFVTCFFYWVLDSVWSFFSFETNLKMMIFSEPASYLDTFLLQVSPYQIVSRLMVVSLFGLSGILIVEFLSKRHAAERDRREAHESLLTVLNSIDATIYVADMQEYRILFMNKFMIDSFGGDYTGKHCYEVFRNQKDRCVHCAGDQIVDKAGNPKGVVVWEGQNPITKAWYINHDRAIKWVDGRVVHLQVATDITHLKELQEKQARSDQQLRQAQKMEAIGNLAGGIAHDFNNILTSILGYTELALFKVDNNSDIAENMQEVLKAGNRAKELVKQILTFARRSDESHKVVEVADIVEEALKFLRSSIPTTIDIVSRIDTQSSILGSATQVHQVMMNLCTNAAQAMEKGGLLEVEVNDKEVKHSEPVGPGSLAPGQYVEIKVSDNGAGIPKEIVSSIFEPYFTTKRAGEGTGMGLALVHGIVESYGGTIEVESQVGIGTSFYIWLPTSKDIKDQLPDDQELPFEGTETILFVDDEAPIAKMVKQMLEQLGYTVTASTSSVEALELFKSEGDRLDLVITDMTMPAMTGDVLIRELLAINPDIPIILCTGYSRNMNMDKALKLGARTLVNKPLLKNKLAKVIREVLDSAPSST